MHASSHLPNCEPAVLTQRQLLPSLQLPADGSSEPACHDRKILLNPSGSSTKTGGRQALITSTIHSSAEGETEHAVYNAVSNALSNAVGIQNWGMQNWHTVLMLLWHAQCLFLCVQP